MQPTINPFGGIIGTITPVGPITGDPIQGVSRLITFGIRMFLLVAGLTVLFYLLWGALDWITAGGDSEKISKAQHKMTNAVIGIVLVVAVLSIFGYLAGDILGIMKRSPQGGWVFVVPTFK